MNTHDDPYPFDLGDERRDRRAATLVAAALAQPGETIPAAAGSEAAARATYDFFDNPLVRHEDLDEAGCLHAIGLVARSAGPVLVARDTTELDLPGPARARVLGELAHPSHHGFLLHSALALDADGVPLGLLHQHVWMRPPETRGKKKHGRKKDTADKESGRRLDAERAVADAMPAGRMFVCIGDREADFYDLFAMPRREGHHALARANGVRRVKGREELPDVAVAALPVAGMLEIEVPRKDGVPGRKAVLAIRFGEFSIMPPSTHPRRKELSPLPPRAVLAEEVDPPEGVEAVSWLLPTTLPVESFEDAVRVVRWYAPRWRIERYHYTLKGGCEVEELQLETAPRLRRALAILALVAVRLLRLAYLARREPESSCEAELGREEWEMLHRQFKPGEPLPACPPGMREAVRWLARLGGLLGRKCDKEPGVKTIWRGLKRLHAMVAGFRLASTGPPVHSSRQ